MNFSLQKLTIIAKIVSSTQIFLSDYKFIIFILALSKAEALINREKLDFIIAFGEGLLNLKSDREDLLQIQTIASEILKMDSEKLKIKKPIERDLDMIGNEFSYIMSELVSTDLLMDECGQYALKVLHR